MKLYSFIMVLVSFSSISEAQTFQGKIGSGLTASITISKNGGVANVTRKLLTSLNNEESKLVNLSNAVIVNNQIEMPASGSIFIIPFDPSFPPVQAMTGGCMEYRCHCGPACAPGGAGCEIIIADGTAFCRSKTGAESCSCCAGFLVPVQCTGSNNSTSNFEMGPGSFLLVSADSVNY